jgi:hypothetical protein
VLPRRLEQRLETAQTSAEAFLNFFRNLGHLTGRTVIESKLPAKSKPTMHLK